MKPMSRMAISTFRSALGRGGFAVLFAAALAACSTNDLLNVERPDIIDPGNLQGALGATAYYNGAIGDVAYSQGNFSGLMLMSGLFSDEFIFGGTPPEVRQFDLGAVAVSNSFSQSIYLNLHRGRVSAQKAAAALAAVDPADPRIGEMNALQALSTIWIGEHYCSGAPLSDYGPPIVYGDPLSTEQIFQAAVDLLNTASTKATDARIVNLIKVLKGRALLDLGQYAQAATAVAGVPDDFVYQMLFSSSDPRTQNNMKAFVFDFDYMSVGNSEGTNGLNFATADDPRVPVQFIGPSQFDGKTPDYQLLTYQTFGDPIIDASGVEARLIEAEAALNASDPTTWLAKLNEARTAWPSLTPLTDPGTASARVDLTFRERAFAMFATGHRVGDLRRLVRQYGRAITVTFPTGAYHKDNLTRGNQASIIIPQTEQNNPNYSASGCDPNAA